MPELPEVEIIRRDLLPRVKGKRFKKVVICPDPRGCRTLRRCFSEKSFARRLTGQTIVQVGRRGKYLLFYLAAGDILILHLGMSGRLILGDGQSPLPRHSRLKLELQGDGWLDFADPRKFGEAYLFSEKTGDTKVNPFLLGPEPLSRGFTPEKLQGILKGRKAAIKTALLNQKLIAGLGNIYADEALHQARIHPRRPPSTLTKAEVRNLHSSIRGILRKAIRARGTTADDGGYRDGRGRAGRFQFQLQVYQRKGEPCRRCRSRIQTLGVGGRTAHFCPKCQK